jgi:hypothetical protein
VRDHGELDRLIGTLRRVVGVGDVVRLAV